MLANFHVHYVTRNIQIMIKAEYSEAAPTFALNAFRLVNFVRKLAAELVLCKFA